jgi:Zn-dependent M16 (insulinase) family peptidase
VQLMQRIGRNTGGIHPASFISSAPGRAQAEAWLVLRGKSMLAQAGELFAILHDVLSGARLDDRERLRQMALDEKSSVESGMARGGHSVVNTRLRAHFDEAGWAKEQMGGVSYLFFLRGLLEQIDKDWPAVQQRLEEIREALLNRAGLLANVTVDAAGWQQVRPQLDDFIAGLPAGAARLEKWQPGVLPEVEGLALPSQVNFVGKAGNLFAGGYRLDGSNLAVMNYLNATWLWEKVRVQGGAYGGFCSFDQYSGVLSYLSYRDPNLLDTLAIYDQTAGFLRELELSESELTKSIIGAVGELDAYQLPDAKGYTAMLRHLLGISDEWRQTYREQLLGTRAEDFHALAEAFEGQVAALGSAEALQAVEKEKAGWMSIRQVL